MKLSFLQALPQITLESQKLRTQGTQQSNTLPLTGNLGFPDSDSNLLYLRTVIGGITASERDHNAHLLNKSNIWSVTASLGPQTLSAFWSRVDASFIFAALLLAGTQAKQSLLCTWDDDYKAARGAIVRRTYLVSTELAFKGCLVVFLSPGKEATECYGS